MKEMRDYIITVNSTVDMPKEWLGGTGRSGDSSEVYKEGKTYTDMEA